MQTEAGQQEIDSGEETEAGGGAAADRRARQAATRERARRARFKVLSRMELQEAQKSCGERRKKLKGAKGRLEREAGDKAFEEGKTRETFRQGLGNKRVSIPASTIRTSWKVLEEAKAEARAARGQEPEAPVAPAAGWDARVLVSEPDLVRRVARMEGEAITTVSTEERRNRRTDLTSEQRRTGLLDTRFHEAGPGVSEADMEKL